MTTEKNVETIAQSIMQGAADIETGRVSYLRALVSAAQGEVGKRGQPMADQLAGLSRAHERFYEIVLKVAETFVPKGTKDRSVELHRRANFARTAASALRVHVKAGGDLMLLHADKATKASLRARAGPVRKRSARRLRTMAETRTKSLMSVVIELAETDKEAAREEIQLLLDQLEAQLEGLGEKERIRRAFKPSETTVQRAQARPQ